MTNSFLPYPHHTEHNILLSTQCSCRDVFTCACPRDRKCEVAIADFDSIVEEGAKHSSRRVPGTYGYRAPEVGGAVHVDIALEALSTDTDVMNSS